MSEIQILGNKINCINGYRALFNQVVSDLKSKEKSGYVTVNNVHTMIEGFRDENYQRIINEGYLAIPDGKPLQVVGRLKGNKEISRLFGPSVMEHFIDWGREEGLTHFFFGSSEANLQKLRQAINDKYPGTKIVGMVSPPFMPMDQWDNASFISAINEARPDLVWIGLGAPKQEKWMAQHYQKINRGILFGIGAGFDYLAGNTRHAPKWMKNASLEWVYRLTQEPKRLWKRYLNTIPHFIVLASAELLGFKVKKTKSS